MYCYNSVRIILQIVSKTKTVSPFSFHPLVNRSNMPVLGRTRPIGL